MHHLSDILHYLSDIFRVFGPTEVRRSWKTRAFPHLWNGLSDAVSGCYWRQLERNLEGTSSNWSHDLTSFNVRPTGLLVFIACRRPAGSLKVPNCTVPILRSYAFNFAACVRFQKCLTDRSIEGLRGRSPQLPQPTQPPMQFRKLLHLNVVSLNK